MIAELTLIGLFTRSCTACGGALDSAIAFEVPGLRFTLGAIVVFRRSIWIHQFEVGATAIAEPNIVIHGLQALFEHLTFREVGIVGRFVQFAYRFAALLAVAGMVSIKHHAPLVQRIMKQERDREKHGGGNPTVPVFFKKIYNAFVFLLLNKSIDYHPHPLSLVNERENKISI